MKAYLLKQGGTIRGFYSTEEKAVSAAEKEIETEYSGSFVDKDPWIKHVLHKSCPCEELKQLWVLSPSGIFYTISKINIQ